MYREVVESKKQDFEKAMEHFRAEISKIGTGRASASLVEGLKVEYYDNPTPLNQVASISVPEPRTITIQPWDKGVLGSIEKAVRESDLNINPINDGNVVRLNVPALTEERRMDLVKVLNQKAEEARISIRNIREDAMKEFQLLEKEGKISEDDKFKGKDELQKIVDEYNKKVEEAREKKENDIMTV